jgi:NADPH-dependent 2,4-dienoyl-CoA reductase/sulfur reductase-like enzyme
MAEAQTTRICDVAVVGGGPAGLAAATVLKRRGVGHVVLIEREAEAGGIPRHCGHPPFGMRELQRVMTGPAYARALVKEARRAGVEIRTGTSVVALGEGGALEVVSAADGPYGLSARRVVLATGVRESSRAARLVSGERPLGILNTGALQAMVYLKHRIPFRRPAVIGTELVAFSALLTCRKAGIRPVAMIEAGERPTARWPSAILAHLLGVKLHCRTSLVAIDGASRVERIRVRGGDGRARAIECDGVLFTGGFRPEATLVRMGHLAFDPHSGGPVVDQFGRCSDPAYFAAGNLLRPVETAGWSWREGADTAGWIADDLAGRLPHGTGTISIDLDTPVTFAVPQRLSLPLDDRGMRHIQLRVDRPVRGTLAISDGQRIVWSRRVDTRPERRLLIPVSALGRPAAGKTITIALTNEQGIDRAAGAVDDSNPQLN